MNCIKNNKKLGRGNPSLAIKEVEKMSYERYREVLSDLKRILLEDISEGRLDEFQLTRLSEEIEEIQDILAEELEFYED